MHRRTPSPLVLSLLLCAACGGDPHAAAPHPTAPDPSAAATAGAVAGQGGAAPSAASSTQPAAGPGPAPAPAPPTAPVLAADSHPPGVTPLGAAEEDELKARCDGLVKHLRKATARDDNSAARLARLRQLLDNPPAIAGTDVPRCALLLERSLVAYRAQRIESEGMNGIKRILVGLSMAMSAAKPALCASAPPVPAELKTLRDGPQPQPPSAWQAPGWRCTRVNLQGAPQHFQYELRTDPATGHYAILARGYPVLGQAPVELFVEGRVKDGAVTLTSDVYRRSVSR